MIELITAWLDDNRRDERGSYLVLGVVIVLAILAAVWLLNNVHIDG